MSDLQFLRISEVAQMLALSEKAVRKLIDAGKLPRYSPSPGARSVRVLKSDVEAFIDPSAIKPHEPRVNRNGFSHLEKFGFKWPGRAGSQD